MVVVSEQVQSPPSSPPPHPNVRLFFFHPEDSHSSVSSVRFHPELLPSSQQHSVEEPLPVPKVARALLARRRLRESDAFILESCVWGGGMYISF